MLCMWNVLLINRFSSFHMNRAKGTRHGGGKADSSARLTTSTVLGTEWVLYACMPADGSVLEPWLPVRLPSALIATPRFSSRHQKVIVPDSVLHFALFLPWRMRAKLWKGRRNSALTSKDVPKINIFVHQRSKQGSNGHASPGACQQTAL